MLARLMIAIFSGLISLVTLYIISKPKGFIDYVILVGIVFGLFICFYILRDDKTWFIEEF